MNRKQRRAAHITKQQEQDSFIPVRISPQVKQLMADGKLCYDVLADMADAVINAATDSLISTKSLVGMRATNDADADMDLFAWYSLTNGSVIIELYSMITYAMRATYESL